MNSERSVTSASNYSPEVQAISPEELTTPTQMCIISWSIQHSYPLNHAGSTGYKSRPSSGPRALSEEERSKFNQTVKLTPSNYEILHLTRMKAAALLLFVAAVAAGSPYLYDWDSLAFQEQQQSEEFALAEVSEQFLSPMQLGVFCPSLLSKMQGV